MDIFIKITLAALGVVAVLIFVIAMVRRVAAKLTAESLLKYGRGSPRFIYNLLSTAYPKQRLFSNVTLPKEPANPQSPRAAADLISVGRGGVCIIKVMRHRGFIENPNKGDWCQVYGDKFVPFRNPFEQNAACLKALERIFKAENVYNVPILNLAVFVYPDVKFKTRQDYLYTADRLLVALHDINRSRFLSGREIKAAAAAIRKHAKPVATPKPGAPGGTPGNTTGQVNR